MSHYILPKRLRQLISVAARGLETPADAHAIYFLLLAQSHPTPPSPSTSTWHLVCRSNTVPASSNPEWDPIFLADTNLPDHILATSQILIITVCCSYNNKDNKDKEEKEHISTLITTTSTTSTTSSLNNHIIYTNTKDTPTIQLDLRSLQSADNNALHLLQTALQPILLLPSTTTLSSSSSSSSSSLLSSVVVNAAYKVNLPHLCYLGDDLGTLPHQLPPNSILLEYGDGYYTPSLLLEVVVPTSYDKKKGSELSSSAVGGDSIHQNNTTNSKTLQQPRYSSPVKLKQVAAVTDVVDNNGVDITIKGEGGEDIMVMSTEDEGGKEEGGSYSEIKSRNNSSNTNNGGGGKKLSLSQLQQSTVSLSALKERAADLRSVRDGKCRQLELLKSTSSKLKDQKAGLGALCQETQALKLRNEALQRKKAALQHQATTIEQTIAARAQALATTLKVAQAADKRVNDARLAVAGEAGCERFVQITRELVVRRCTLVCQVCKVMRLGPSSLFPSKGGGGGGVQPSSSTNAVRRSHLSSSYTTTTPPSSSSLTEVLEVGWAGAATPSITAGKSEYLKVDLTDTTATTNNNISIERKATSSSTTTNNNNNNHPPPPHPPPPTMAVLSIGGLKVLDPEILRRIFTEEYMSSDPEPDEDKALSVALGYVALLVDRLAGYLEIPCRYPIKLKGSVCSIMDGWESGGSWREEEVVVSRGLFSSWVGSGSSGVGSGGGGGGVQTIVVQSQATRPNIGGTGGTTSYSTTTTTSSSSMVRKEYPLHCFGGIRERGRFAIGVFLLNKNVVQLLQMHGIGGGGASQLLGNLYKLLVAAKSAV